MIHVYCGEVLLINADDLMQWRSHGARGGGGGGFRLSTKQKKKDREEKMVYKMLF